MNLASGDPRDVQKVVDQAGHVAHLTRGEVAGRFNRRGVGAGQANQLQGVADWGQGVAQLVGQHRQELVLAAVGLGKFVGPAAEFFLHPATLGGVAHDLGETAEMSGVVLDRRNDARGPESRPVLSLVPALVEGPPLGGGGFHLDLVNPGLAVLGREDDGDLTPEDLVLGVTQDAFGSVIPTGDPSLHIGHEDGEVLDSIDQQAEAFLAFPEGVDGVLALGDVGQDANGAGEEVEVAWTHGVDGDAKPAVAGSEVERLPAAGFQGTQQGRFGLQGEEFGQGMADQVEAGVAEEFARGLVAAKDLALGVE